MMNISFNNIPLSSGCGNEEEPKWDPIITEDEEDKLREELGPID